MTTVDDVAQRLRTHAAATTRAEYADLEAAVEAAAACIGADADDAADLVAPLVDVLRAQVREVSTADALVHDPSRASAIEARVARLVKRVARTRPSFVLNHARDLAAVAIEQDDSLNDAAMALSTLVSEDPAAFAACCRAAAEAVDGGSPGARREAFDLVADIVESITTWLPADTATEPTAAYEDDADTIPSTPPPIREAAAVDAVATAAVSAVDADASDSTAAARAYATIARAAPDAAAPGTPWVVHAIRSGPTDDRCAALLDAIAALAAARPGAITPYLSALVDALRAPDEAVRETAGEALSAVAYREQVAVLEVLPAVAAGLDDDSTGTAPALDILASAAKGDAYSPDDVPDAVLKVVDSVTAVLDADDAAVLEPATEVVETVADAAFDQVPALATSSTVENLVDIASRDPGVLTRLHATRTLGAIAEHKPDKRSVVLDELLARLDADPVDRRASALQALDSILEASGIAAADSDEASGSRRVLPALVDLLRSSTHELAVDALTTILGRDPDAIEYIREDVEDATAATEPRVRVAGYELVTAAAAEDPTAFVAFDDAVKRGLDDQDQAVVNAALEAAREVTPEHHEVVEPLLPAVAACLYSEAEETRRTAAWVLVNVSKEAPEAVANEHDAILSAFADAAPTADPDDTLDVTQLLVEVLSNIVDADPTVAAPVTDELAAVARTMTHELDRTARYALEALAAAGTETPAARDDLMYVYEDGTPMAATEAASYVPRLVDEVPAAADAFASRLCERNLDDPARIDAIAACERHSPTVGTVAVPALLDVVTTEDPDDQTTLVGRAIDALATVAAADESVVESVAPVVVDILFETTESAVASAAVEALSDLATAHSAATRAALPAAATDTRVDLFDLKLTADGMPNAVRCGLAADAATERFEAAFAYRTLAADDPDAAVSLLNDIVAHVEREPRLTRLQLYGAIDALAESHVQRVAETLPTLVDGVLRAGPTPTVDDSGFTDALAFPLVDALLTTVIGAPERTPALVERLRDGLAASTRGERIHSALYLAVLAIAQTEAPADDHLAAALEDAEPALCSLLDGVELERQSAAFALTTLATALPDALPVLRDLLDRADHPLAGEAVEVLTLVSENQPRTLAETPGGVPALVAGADHHDAAVRAEAVAGLRAVASSTDDQRATAAVGDALTDPASDVREEAARAFGRVSRQPDPLDPALPGLARALTSDDPSVREAAIGALEFHLEPSDHDLDAAALVAAVANDDDAVTASALDLLVVVARNRPQDVVDAGLDPLRDELAGRDPDTAGDVLRVLNELVAHVPDELHSLVPVLRTHLQRDNQSVSVTGFREPNLLATGILQAIAEAEPAAVVDAVPDLSRVFFETEAGENTRAVSRARDALHAVGTERPDAVAVPVDDAVTALESVDATRRQRGLVLLTALVDADVVPIQAVRPTATALVADDDPDVGAAAAAFLEAAVSHTEATAPDDTVPVLLDATQSGEPDRRGKATAALAAIAKDTPDAVPIEAIQDLLTADDYTTAGSAIHCLHAHKDVVDLTAGERAVVQETIANEADQRTKVAGIDLLAATDTTAAATPQ